MRRPENDRSLRYACPDELPRTSRAPPPADVGPPRAGPSDLTAPLFVKEGLDEPAAVTSMPGQAQHTIESLRKEAAEIRDRGVLAFVLFGVPLQKDAEGSEAWNPDGVGQRAVA